jgi:hypothetical protein
MVLKVVSQSTKNRTYGWDPPPGVEWYLFYAQGKRVSNAPPVAENGVVKKTIQFSKGTEPHEVVAIIRRNGVMSVDVGVWPATSQSDENYSEEPYGNAVYSH